MIIHNPKALFIAIKNTDELAKSSAKYSNNNIIPIIDVTPKHSNNIETIGNIANPKNPKPKAGNNFFDNMFSVFVNIFGAIHKHNNQIIAVVTIAVIASTI